MLQKFKNDIGVNSILVVIVVLLGFAYTQKTELYRFLDMFGVVPRAELLTELYFTDTENLPQSMVADQNESFGVTIRNLEGRDMDYVYKSSLSFPENPQVELLSSGIKSLHIKDGATANIIISYKLNRSYTEKGLMTVSLIGRNEKIHFLLNK